MTTKSIMKSLSFLLLLFIFLTNTTQAQLFKSNTELGFKGGVSHYTGDLNSNHFNTANPAASFIVRRNIDRRFDMLIFYRMLEILLLVLMTA